MESITCPLCHFIFEATLKKSRDGLIYLPLVAHIYVAELGHRWLRYWLGACPTPRH